MGFDDFLDDGKPQADTCRPILPRHTVERLEEPAEVLGFDAFPAVGHRESHHSCFGLGADRYRPTGAREPQRIGQQIRQNVLQPFAVTKDIRQVIRHGHGQSDALVLGLGQKRLDGVPDHCLR